MTQMNRLIILVTLAMLSAYSKESEDSNQITAAEAYRKLAEIKSYPSSVNDRVLELVADTNKFGMYEFNEVEISILKHCQKEDWSWKNTLSVLPMRFVFKFMPMGMGILAFPEYAIIKQLDFATTCVKPSYLPGELIDSSTEE